MTSPVLEYVGHIVSKGGIASNPRKIEDIKNWSFPQTVTDVQTQKRRSVSYRHDKGMEIAQKDTSGEESKEDNTENEQNEENWIPLRNWYSTTESYIHS